ncbi:GDSL esterase/lipase 1 [Cajanus cajan]|uniref:GDSL esterase/lipase 1 n=1 Tax=Cajanus cajan TaxID=3821 RepID=UPI00098DB28B|nr:GDSL esterase/lipase 1 [Cajanus cajan]
MGRVRRININLWSGCLVLVLLNITSIDKGDAELKMEKEEKAMFVFGDSIFDPGNIVYVKGREKWLESLHWPYGETYFKHPTGRFSDGRIVPDFIATLAGLPMLSPYLQPHPTPFTYGANFAAGGVGVIVGQINLPTQLNYLKQVVKSLKQELGDRGAKRILEKAVYLFSFGGNDYLNFHSQNPNSTKSERRIYIDLVIGNLTNGIKAVYSVGGRKFAYLNIMPIGCAPISRVVSSGACEQELMEMAREHNKAFSKALKKLERELPGFRYSIFDYYKSIIDRIKHPYKYGLKESKTACCGVGPFRRSGCGENRTFEVCSEPFEYLWFDQGHPTEKVNLQIADLIWSGPPNLCAPYNVKTLFGY